MRITTAFVAGIACIGISLAAQPVLANEDKDADKSSDAKPEATGDENAEVDPDSSKAAQAVRARASAATSPQVQRDPTTGRGTIGALLGYGFKDGVNLGFGARGGYTMPFNAYLGATFLYHLGKSEGGGSAKLYYFGVEGGYDLAIGQIVIRPYVGIGRVAQLVEIPADLTSGINAESQSNGFFGVWPGAAAFYTMGSFFAGLDARYLIVENANAFTINATGGILL